MSRSVVTVPSVVFIVLLPLMASASAVVDPGDVDCVAAARALADIEVALRSNAAISLEPFGEPDPDELARAADTEALWASGRHDEAIRELEALEEGGAAFAVTVSWKEPIAVEDAKLYYADVRVSTRTGGEDASLDFHAGTGNIFVLVVWASGWTLNMSTDGGASFTETAFWSGYAAIADMSVSGDFVWVGYSADGDSFHSSRFRRFHAETGLEDASYGYEVVADESPNTMVELEVVGNTPDQNTWICMAYLLDEDHSIHFWWDDLSGDSFVEVSPPVANAAGGLDLAWNPFFTSGHALWISYIATDDTLRVYRSTASDWQAANGASFTGLHNHTALSAYADHVYVAVECEVDPGLYGVCYLATDTAGSGWSWGHAYWPDVGSPSGFRPDLSLRSGAGRAAVFSSETGDVDDVYYVTRPGWTEGPWSDPVWYNTWDHVAGDETYIEWLGSLCVQTYGMLYFDGNGDSSPYFDLMHPRSFSCDGFESGDLGGWSSTSP